ncbi:imelysin family protein [uncultured Psychrosphaera sp.]|uniref:imelysin family protein n=1 Tax=uncultured Psychrosphaera sp. TaxID=1403522 RepID=UPI00260775C9|nr:imelysin family protein [uncultured Psychrosphaera sp.]
MFKKSCLSILVSVTLLSACGSDNDDDNTSFDFDATPMITNLTEDVIVAGYVDLNTKAEAFVAAITTLSTDKTEANLAAAQQAWKDVRQPWEQGESHIFGPVDSLSIDPHLDSWPLNTSDLESLLSTQDSFTADGVRNSNDDVQGFHTMEFLLFGDGVEDNTKAITEMTDLEIEYLSATAEVFNGYTQDLEDAWLVASDANNDSSEAYKDYLLETDNEIYSSQVGVIEELINGLIGIVDEVGNGKISDPFGADIDSTDTSLVESQYSWNSLADFTDNITGVQNVYRGEFDGEADAAGIIDFVDAADSELATRVDEEIATAIANIEAIAGSDDLPFRQAINDADARVRIQTAIDSLSVLQTSLENDVLLLLNEWNVQ